VTGTEDGRFQEREGSLHACCVDAIKAAGETACEQIHSFINRENLVFMSGEMNTLGH
jgi:hypothetical protein